MQPKINFKLKNLEISNQSFQLKKLKEKDKPKIATGSK